MNARVIVPPVIEIRGAEHIAASLAERSPSAPLAAIGLVTAFQL